MIKHGPRKFHMVCVPIPICLYLHSVSLNVDDYGIGTYQVISKIDHLSTIHDEDE